MNQRPPPLVPDHTLLRLIGRGSYGEVWLARNVMGTHRAVKVVHRTSFENERPYEREFGGIKRYEPVSRGSDALIHILHVGRDNSAGYFYVVMELADDADPESAFRIAPDFIAPATYQPRTLRAELRRQGRLPVSECLDVATQLCAGLVHLHQHGLVHRDIKPSNIIFVHGHPKLADIGLVGEMGESRSFVGTEGFIPPEGPGTPEADIYAFGKVLYEASTGLDRQKFPEIPPDWIGHADADQLLEFHEIVLKACEGPATRRYENAVELQADLALLRSGRSVRKLRALERRNQVLVRIIAASFVLAVVGAVLTWIIHERTSRERHQIRQIEHAQALTRAQLGETLVAQARAERTSHAAGVRSRAWAAVTNAVGNAPPSALRNEAIATLALTDLGEPVRQPALPGVTDTQQIVDLAFDAGRERYAVVEETRRVHILSVTNRAFLASFSLDESPRALRFSADGRWIASWLPRAGLVFHDWSYETRVPLTLREPREPASPSAFDFHAGRRVLAVGGSDASVNLVSLWDGSPIASYAVPGAVRAVSLRADGLRLAVVASDSAWVWDLEHPDSAPYTHRFDGPLVQVAWHPDGQRLAVGFEDGRVRVWHPALDTAIRFDRHENAVAQLAFSPDGTLLASTAWDGSTRLWDARSSGLLAISEAGQARGFSPDGTRLFFANGHGQWGWWQVIRSSVFETLDHGGLAQPRAESLGFSPDGARLAWSGQPGVGVYELATRTPRLHRTRARVADAHFDPAGRLVAGVGTNLLVWPRGDLTESPQVVPLPSATDESGAPLSPADRQPGYWDAAPGGQLFAWAATRCAYFGTNLASLRVLVPARVRQLVSAAVSADGRWFALGDWDGSVLVFDAAGRELTRLPVGAASLRFHPAKPWLHVAAGAEINAWAAPDWKRANLPPIPRDSGARVIVPLAFHARDGVFAYTRSSSDIRLDSTDSFAERATLGSPQPHLVWSIALAPDGTQLAAGTDFGVQLWHLDAIHRELKQAGIP